MEYWTKSDSNMFEGNVVRGEIKAGVLVIDKNYSRPVFVFMCEGEVKCLAASRRIPVLCPCFSDVKRQQTAQVLFVSSVSPCGYRC